jgi:hypothetical protein
MSALPLTSPVTLEGRHASLVPLSPAHADALARASAEGE